MPLWQGTASSTHPMLAPYTICSAHGVRSIPCAPRSTGPKIHSTRGTGSQHGACTASGMWAGKSTSHSTRVSPGHGLDWLLDQLSLLAPVHIHSLGSYSNWPWNQCTGPVWQGTPCSPHPRLTPVLHGSSLYAANIVSPGSELVHAACHAEAGPRVYRDLDLIHPTDWPSNPHPAGLNKLDTPGLHSVGLSAFYRLIYI